MANINAVQNNLEKVLDFLRPLLSLANCHMVNFLNGNFWETYISPDIRKEYNEIGLTGVYKIFRYYSKLTSEATESDMNILLQNCPHMQHHFSAARSLYLVETPNICLSHNLFQEKLKSWNCGESKDFTAIGFMTAKKTHEVEMMTHVVAAISSLSESTHIIDIGSGRGYLSSMLALQHGLRVLGVDSSHINTHSAEKRSEKLEKFWPGLSRRAAEHFNNDTPKKRGKHWKSKCVNNGPSSSEKVIQNNESVADSSKNTSSKESLYRQITTYIKENSNLLQIVQETFPEDTLYSNLSLVGLHTCGNLSATCLKLFLQNENIKAVCNVGCCYHLVEEEFFRNPFNSETDDSDKEFGFPMSQFLVSKKFALGRNARMLAAQAIDRLSEKEEVSNNSLFFRALLQVILNDKLGEDRTDWQVGRIAAKCSNFMDYCTRSFKRLNLQLELTDEEILAYYEKHIEKKNELEAFFLFRVALAPIVEAVILLDRLLYLLEQGIKEAHIVQLFNPVISPRCNAIVALKNLECL